VEAADRLIRAEVDGAVAEVVLSSPPVNQLSHRFLEELNGALDSLPPETRALVVSSDVPGIFMAGGDIDFLTNGDLEEQGRYVRWVQSTFNRFEQMSGPVVVGIDGACLGGGLELSLACDIRVVSESARLGLPEVQLGILPGAGGTQRMVRAIGQGAARDLLLTGRRVSGKEALGLGIASRLVGEGQAADAARDLARSLASGAVEAIQAIKRLALAGSENTIEAGLEQEWREWMNVRGSANAQEGLSAFLEKRDPVYR
jgi:enoyl-CoA hydratase/carnithine racemase